MAIRIGVVGAGQLARMLHQAAIPLGLDMVYLGAGPDDPVGRAGGPVLTGSPWPTADELRDLAGRCDVITFEHELVDPAVLDALEHEGVVLAPGAAALAAVIDKAAMRRVTSAAGLPAPRWQVATWPDELAAALDAVPHEGGGVVLKAARGGYDGRGVVIIASDDAGPPVRERAMAEGLRLLERSAVLVEQLVPLDAEVAVVTVRSADARIETYDPVLTVQVDGQCREVRLPCGLDPALADEARRLARHAAEAVGVVGLLAVELLVSGGELLLNELAARPHNSGHLTIEAAATSQFENHLRAVAGLPLGPTHVTVAEAAMVNLIGAPDATDPTEHLAAGLAADPGAHVHLYGKSVRPERKVGHVTVCSPTTSGLTSARAWDVVRTLGASTVGSGR